MTLKINFTPRMKEFLRRQMVMTEFELEMHLKRRRREIIAEMERLQEQLRDVESELLELADAEVRRQGGEG